MKSKRSVSFYLVHFIVFNYTPVSHHTYLHNIKDMMTLKVPMMHTDLVRVMAQRVTVVSGTVGFESALRHVNFPMDKNNHNKTEIIKRNINNVFDVNNDNKHSSLVFRWV